MSLQVLPLYDDQGTPYQLADGRQIRDLNGDDVRDALGVFDAYDRPGAPREDAFAHALEAWRACRMRRAIADDLARRKAEGVVVSGSFR